MASSNSLRSNPICIVGTGACTAVGLTAPATAAAVRAGVDGFEEHPFMINQEGDPYILAMVPSIDLATMGFERYTALAIPAVEEALLPLQQLSPEKFAVDVTIGLPEQRPGLPDDLQRTLGGALKSLSSEHYAINDVRVALRGHAAGLMAIESASKQLIAGSSIFCLAGGLDSYIAPDTLDWIEGNEQLHTPNNAWGFIPGEASAFCLLCTMETANRFGLPIKAKLLSIGTKQEENKIKTETICIGKGLTAAVDSVVQALPQETKINQTYCDQNGEAYRADEFGFMLTRFAENFDDPSEYAAPADCWGDVGAASGPLFINQLCAAAEKGYSLGSVTLLWTSSEGGDRSAAIFIAESSQERRA